MVHNSGIDYRKLGTKVFEFHRQSLAARDKDKQATQCAAKLSRVSDDLQLLIETLGRNREGGANFLSEEGDLELLDHPTKGIELALRFE